MDKNLIVPAPGIYQHYKGGQYYVMCTARHSETAELLVVYMPLYPHVAHPQCTIPCVRPLDQFNEEVQTMQGAQPRFALVLPVRNAGDET